MLRWFKHFKEIFNKHPLCNTWRRYTSSYNPVTNQVRQKSAKLFVSTSPLVQRILTEVLNADLETSAHMSYDWFGKIWSDEDVPQVWKLKGRIPCKATEERWSQHLWQSQGNNASSVPKTGRQPGRIPSQSIICRPNSHPTYNLWSIPCIQFIIICSVQRFQTKGFW